MKTACLALTILLAFCTGVAAQQPNLASQREAMKKLAFLVGKWRGPATVKRGPGEPIKITQNENIQYKLDGLLLLIEGEGTNAEGKRVFGALATVAYDDNTNTYRFRAHNDGRYLETELTVQDKGFSWGYTAGPLKVSNSMKVNESGEWVETTESTYGATPPQRVVEMKLQRQP